MRKRRTIRASVGFGAVLTAALAGGGPAGTATAQPAPAEASAYGESVDVQLIDVEVWVRDGQGNAVTGLGVDDFEVREDGEPVAITNFAEVRPPAAAPSEPAEPTAEAVDPPTPEAPLELREPLGEDPREAEQAGVLVLYFDELFSGATGRKQLIADLRTFVERQRVPPQRVLILRQDGGVEVMANLGSTRAALEAALDILETPSPRGVQTWADERNAMRRLQDEWERAAVFRRLRAGQEPCDFFPTEAIRAIQEHVNFSRTRIEETLAHLTHTGSILGGLPGPKTLVYVSDGLATAPGKALLSFARHLCPDRPLEQRLDIHEGLNEAFVRLSRHANANRVTFYTLQALGLRQNLSMSSADQRSVRLTVQAVNRYDNESRIVQRQGLFMLAEETGGRAVINRSRFVEDLEQIADDMTGYYSLAYAPPHGGDGLDHRIDVRVRGEKLRVRHRPGYRDKSEDQRMIERLESTLYLGLITNPLGISLGAGQVFRGEGPESTVPLHVQVPVERITFLPHQGGERASLKVQAMARAEGKGKIVFKEELYHLPRPSDAPSDQRVSLVFPMYLKEGVHVVALGIRDEATKEASFVATTLEILGQSAAADSGE